jgi:hypothetical protein
MAHTIVNCRTVIREDDGGRITARLDMMIERTNNAGLILQRSHWYGSPVHLGELFLVRKNDVEARCVLRSHQFGWELGLQVGISREFVQTKVCRSQHEVLTTGEQWKAAMLEKSWS